jgi:hypothetical protein
VAVVFLSQIKYRKQASDKKHTGVVPVQLDQFIQFRHGRFDFFFRGKTILYNEFNLPEQGRHEGDGHGVNKMGLSL